MKKYKVLMLLKGKRFEIYLGSETSSSAYATAKELFPKALVIKAEKT